MTKEKVDEWFYDHPRTSAAMFFIIAVPVAFGWLYFGAQMLGFMFGVFDAARNSI